MAEDDLTPIQDRIMRLRALGKSAYETGFELGLSESTIQNHMSAIYDKLDVDGVIPAMRALGYIHVPGEGVVANYTPCGYVASCGRRQGHRGQHGGFREVRE